MAITALSDLIVPQIWNSYMVEKTAEKSKLLQSGIMVNLSELVTDGGHAVNMPFFQDLTGDDEVAPTDGTTALTPGSIGTAQDVAGILNRERAFGSQALAGAMASSDPMDAIAGQVADYWNRRQEVALIASLKGAFGAASMSGNVSDISGNTGAAAKFSAETLIDAQYVLGDAADQLTGIAVHSAVKAKMEKDDLIDFVKDSEGKDIATYRGKAVIVDDSMGVSSGVYTSYLFGAGAVGYAELEVPNAVETYREELKNNDGLITRRRFIMHPRGIAYTGTLDGTGPANSDLETGTNWTRKYENKNIRIVQFKHKV